MRMMRVFGAGAAALALAGLAVPAAAMEPDKRRHHQRHHRGDKNDDEAGAFVAGALLAGAIALFAGSKKKRAVAAPDAGERVPISLTTEPPTGAAGALLDAEAAADACGQATESQGSTLAKIARVTDIASVDPAGLGWDVQGTLELRDGFRDPKPRHSTFRCSVGSEGVPEVRIAGEAMAAR